MILLVEAVGRHISWMCGFRGIWDRRGKVIWSIASNEIHEVLIAYIQF